MNVQSELLCFVGTWCFFVDDRLKNLWLATRWRLTFCFFHKFSEIDQSIDIGGTPSLLFPACATRNRSTYQ